MSASDFDHLNGSLVSYLDSIRDRSPAPGGGSVAACTTCLGCALAGMVFNYTIGNEKYRAHERELSALREKNDGIMEILKGYIDEDCRVYKAIRRYSRKDPGAAERFLKRSAEIQFDICQKALEIVSFAVILLEKGNPNLMSDAAMSAQVALSAFRSARINMMINLEHINDTAFCDEIITKMKGWEDDAEAKSRQAYLRFMEGLKKIG